MSSSQTAISVRGIGKSYRIEHKTQRAVAEPLLHRLRRPFRRATEDIWALKDVSFDIGRGEIVGVIGRNGAGKSTLFKILSRIVEPSCGEARICGRTSSLIEVGTGFQPELTGRENIFLNGTILGMRRREIARRFDEIVDFSGVEQFLDTPVKYYSSGMYVRLAFAVAAHLDTDILLVDEVLSVGDAEFQKKSLGKMGGIASEGRTVVFVSHNMATLETLCQTGLFFSNGMLVDQGPLKDILSQYHLSVRSDLAEEGGADGPRHLAGRYKYFRSADILNNEGKSVRIIPMGSRIAVWFVVHAPAPIDYPIFEVMFYSATGRCMMGMRSPNTQLAIARLDAVREITCVVDCLPFAPGDYTVSVSLLKGGAVLETAETGLMFLVRDSDTFADGWGACSAALCVAPSRWRMAQPQLQNVAS